MNCKKFWLLLPIVILAIIVQMNLESRIGFMLSVLVAIIIVIAGEQSIRRFVKLP